MREFKIGDKVKCDFYGEGVVARIDSACMKPLYVHFEISGGWWYGMDGKMAGMEGYEKYCITLIEEEEMKEVQETKINDKEEVMNKFNIGDKVWDMRTMDIGEVIEIDSDNDIKVQYKEYCSFYNINGKVSYNDFCPTIRLIGEDIIIKSPVLPPEPPKRTFKDIIEDINKCKKEFVAGENNYTIQLRHSVEKGVDGILTIPFVFIQSQFQYYNEEVQKFIEEIKDLNFFKEFIDWFNGKTIDYNSVDPAPEVTVQPEISCDEYPELTGEEEIGTVGYVGEHLVQIVADKDATSSYDICYHECDLESASLCADYCYKRHFKLYKA